jgi:type II secretory pathway component PulK
MSKSGKERSTRTQGQRSAQVSERGIALIIVMSFLTVLVGLVTEFSTNSTVNFVSAVNARESMRAQFLNRSGANLAQLIIRVQTDVLDKNRKFLGDIQLADYTGLFMGAFGGSSDEVKDMSAMLGGFDGEAIEGLGVSAGQFDVAITTEDGKLNMNCANGSEASRKNLRTQLEALLYFDAYDPIFEKPDADGWNRNREEQVSAFMDYIDKDTAKSEQRGSSEDYGYQSMDDRYKAKNNYIDTTAELKLVRGVDDRFWTLFGGQFTVYGDCKVNIGAVQDPKLIASVIFLSAKNPEDDVIKDPQKLWKLAQRVAEARTFGIYFDDLNAFADFVKSPDGALADLLGGGEDGTPAMPGVAQAAAAVEPIQGVELDQTKLGQVASSGPRRLYRVEVTSTLGMSATGEPRFERKLVGIWDTQVQNQNMRTPDYRKGAWVFWREE